MDMELIKLSVQLSSGIKKHFMKKSRLVKYMVLSTFFFSACNGQTSHKQPPNGYDVRLFEKTPYYDLAKAIKNEDTNSIKRYILSDKNAINYQEPVYHKGFLSFAVITDKLLSTKQLLELGANPNLRSSKTGKSAFDDACLHYEPLQNGDSILSLLIRYGAEVNNMKIDTVVNKYGRKIVTYSTPLVSVCFYGNLFGVKLLVDNGADITIYKGNEGSLITYTILGKNLDMVKYFLIEKKIPVPEYCVIRQEGNPSERKMTLLDLLNENVEMYSPEQKRLREEIIEFLKDKR